MQFVARIGAVDYIHDSKATNVAAAVASIESVDTILVLVAGGDGKGGALDDLAIAVADKLRAAVLIGKDAEKIARTLDTIMPVTFADTMSADEGAAFRIDGAMMLARLREIVEDVYGFALKLDWTSPDNNARAWYVSAEKLEPRLGERFEEPIEPYEQPLSPGRDAVRMHADILAWEGDDTVAAFLLRHPQHRHIARRAQIAAGLPYAEIRDNTISAALLPIDLLRCKLAFFGATHFDPRSDRWVRINMFQDAPFPHELSVVDADDWSYPPLPEANE